MHVVVAVAAGSLLGLLPDVVVKLVVAALFLTGSVLLFRAARSAEAEEAVTDEQPVAATVAATVLGSFGLVVLAEWGDLTQLATASLAAKSDEPRPAVSSWPGCRSTRSTTLVRRCSAASPSGPSSSSSSDADGLAVTPPGGPGAGARPGRPG